jgi:hypothetical protein
VTALAMAVEIRIMACSTVGDVKKFRILDSNL